MEVTTQYVDNIKYGKDLTKLVVIQKENPEARRLIISSAGFTSDVVERANAAGIQTFTYQKLFSAFEKWLS